MAARYTIIRENGTVMAEPAIVVKVYRYLCMISMAICAIENTVTAIIKPFSLALMTTGAEIGLVFQFT